MDRTLLIRQGMDQRGQYLFATGDQGRRGSAMQADVIEAGQDIRPQSRRRDLARCHQGLRPHSRIWIGQQGSQVPVESSISHIA